MVVVPKAETEKTDVPAFWKSRYLLLLLEKSPPPLPKFIARPVPAKVDDDWKRLNRLAVVMLSEKPRIALPCVVPSV